MASLLAAALFSAASIGQMSLEQKVGQLFIAPLSPMRDEDHFQDWSTLQKTCHIGSVILKQSTPEKQLIALARLEKDADIPLLVTADAEWGLGMRMQETISFPRNMTLGAIQDLKSLESLALEIAREAHLVGIHLNFAPVLDVNNNPRNPIIGMRSFGENPAEVAKRGEVVIRGFQKNGLLACAKHFPGHGNTDVDSHRGLPQIPQSLDSIRRIELPPFQAAIDAGVSSIMTAHILVPALDPDWPATLSPKILTDLLRNELRFHGLIITDALNMKALSDRYTIEEIALKAHEAGADLLLYGAHKFEDVDQLMRVAIPRAYRAILAAYHEKRFPISKLDAAVERIFKAKRDAGLFSPSDRSFKILDTSDALALKKRLFQEAISIRGELKLDESHEIIHLDQVQSSHQTYGFSQEFLAELQAKADQKHVILCLYGSPYAASVLPRNATILYAFENDPMAKEAIEAILSGTEKIKGRLPIEEAAPN